MRACPRRTRCGVPSGVCSLATYEHSDRVAESAEQVLQEERLGAGGLGGAHVGVTRAAAVEIVIPAHGVVIAVGPALVALLVALDEHVDGRIDRLEVVVLVLALEARG